MKASRVALVACLMLSACAPKAPYARANLLLSDAEKSYGAAGEAVGSLGNDGRPIPGQETEQLGHLLTAFDLNFTAKEIADLQFKYLAAGDRVKLTASEHAELLSAIDQIVKSADNLVTNQELQKSISPSLRPLLEDADRKVKQAYGLISHAPHGE